VHGPKIPNVPHNYLGGKPTFVQILWWAIYWVLRFLLRWIRMTDILGVQLGVRFVDHGARANPAALRGRRLLDGDCEISEQELEQVSSV
jgi:hypothetical protein